MPKCCSHWITPCMLHGSGVNTSKPAFAKPQQVTGTVLGLFVLHSCLFHNHKPGVCATSCLRFGFSTFAKITLVKHLAFVLLQGVRWQIAAHDKDAHNYSPKDYYIQCITSLHSLEREDQSWPLQRDPRRIQWNCTSVLHINHHKLRALHSSACPFLPPAVPSSFVGRLH